MKINLIFIFIKISGGRQLIGDPRGEPRQGVAVIVNTFRYFSAFLLAACLFSAPGRVSSQVGKTQPSPNASRSHRAAGEARFEVRTSIPAVTVHGRTSALVSTFDFEAARDAFLFAELRAVVVTKTVSTGMALRDRHMRRDIFQTADGQRPDLEFLAPRVRCPRSGATARCDVKGVLVLRGRQAQATAGVTVVMKGGRLNIEGHLTVRLSDHGIEPPSQLGVRVRDEVEVRFTLRGQPVTTGGQQ